MRFKTLFSLLLIFVAAWILASTIVMNREPIQISLAFLQPFSLELWMMLLGAFGAGAALILFFDIAGGARRRVGLECVCIFGHECVQRRLACSVGESPTGEKVSAP